ncbi:MAG: glutamine--fructose-6-phosphate transaminase (isomerizing) [Clostridia bacterium]|nr:glutamine--fructose-6-phosphate transaminase (isomerizing) [Clostridia bacterium]
MCGIVGYVGEKQAAPVLLDGLEKLEYRGYDSAGLAVLDGKNNINIARAKGKLCELFKKTDGGKALEGVCGIGHTRWATHGEPSENNAHPHFNDDKTIAAVHNGIIENYAELKGKLSRQGYEFYSETDTEVATKLVDYYYKKHGDPVRAIANFVLRVRGSYALAVLFKDYPDQIFAVRKDSPMIIGVAGGEAFIASDVPAILKYTKSVYYVANTEIAHVEKGKVTFYNLDKEVVEKDLTEITWNAQSAEKDGYEHFMLKEMHEQPRVVKDTVNGLIKDGKIDFSDFGLSDKDIAKVKHITVVACGSAYHAGVAAQYVLEELARIPVRVELSSEFRYRNPVADKNCLVIVISQSGETADSLAALREAKKLKMKTLAIVNVLGSSIAREADGVLYTKAGPEIAVATTKAYSSQLIAGYALALKFATVRNTITQERYKELLSELSTLPEKIECILKQKESIQHFASEAANKKNVFFIGRGVDYAVCIEGSLKLKEISYVHSEAYAAGELKHGPISLIEDGTLVIGVLMQENLIEKTLSNLVETKSRGAYIAAVTCGDDKKVENVADVKITVPYTDGLFAASLAVIPLQLFAYYLSVLKGNDVDKPRNLAKSVTVE